MFSSHELIASTVTAAPKISVWVFVQACVLACKFASVPACALCPLPLFSRSVVSIQQGNHSPVSGAGGSLYSISLTPFFMLKYLSQSGSIGTSAHGRTSAISVIG